VANAVFDGADATMLSGETANGAFPAKAVATMCAIAANAEVGLEADATFSNVWNNTPKPVTPLETVASSAVKASIDMGAVAMVVFTDNMLPATLLAKYKPPVPVVVVTTKPSVAAQCNVISSLVPMLVDKAGTSEAMMPAVLKTIRALGIAKLETGDLESDQVIVVENPIPADIMISGVGVGSAIFKTLVVGDELANLIKPTGYMGDHTISFCSTKIGLENVTKPSETVRKTKILCTMGPKCWDEANMAALIDAGMGVARFNFSHGEHAAHQEVLDRFRKVCAEKKAKCATLLDTKGPEVRTAMLKDHEPIYLDEGQDIIVYAAGPDEYTTFEGYKTPEETKIGCSYAKLCSSVKPGSKLLFADGTIVIEVVEILDERNLKGKVLNSSKLGERKNGNLPGVKVELDVLQPKDIEDIKSFACKNDMDYIAVSFVQTGEDVQMVRKILDENGGPNIQIISKIENEEGMRNFDEILKYTDGVMVARGDLGMEIPSEKVALAQKLLITKCNIAGKFVICATQMLESMCENPLPTRAEMLDVANAVFDGADATMLSGETANGAFPAKAVETMAAIAANAEEGVNRCQVYNFIRDFTPMPVGSIEAVVSCAAKTAVDLPDLGCIVVFSEGGYRANLTSKYRPACPIVVVTSNESVVRHTNTLYGQYAFQLPAPATEATESATLTAAVQFAVDTKLCKAGAMIAVISGVSAPGTDTVPKFGITVAPGVFAPSPLAATAGVKTVSLRATAISLSEVFSPDAPVRKTKIVCTMGPKCWGEPELAQLLDAGMGVARFNFSHGDHAAHQEVLDRFRKVCGAKGVTCASLMDTKGPEIRTAMLKDHEPIMLEAGQAITIEAVGDKYTEYEGFKNDTETRIGLSYANLCASVKPGNNILIADGSISIQVDSIVSKTVLKGTVLNTKKLGERKNCNLPGVKVDIPVLTKKDVDDVQNFCCKNKMDFIAASFVQTGADVLLIRKILDDAGGKHVQIISKIENEEGVANIDEILKYTDGIMVARGDLGMEIPSEKVALAQKMLITKANVAGRFAICATQMLESMCANPLPTRAEMTDVANAVWDGADATMLSGETANGAFPAKAVETMAAIAANAELAKTTSASVAFLRDFTQRPFTTLESAAASAAAGAIDCAAELIVVVSATGTAARAVSKYRPPCPVLVVTADEAVARQTGAFFAQYPMLVANLAAEKWGAEKSGAAVTKAKELGIMKPFMGMAGAGNVVVVAGPDGGDADSCPVVSFL
jgi:pyruvate kinase